MPDAGAAAKAGHRPPAFGTGSELGDLVRRFVDAEVPEARIRQLMDDPTGFDQRAWDRLARELGITGLHLHEDLGGSGAGLAEVTTVLFELGRSLAVPQYLTTVALAATALAHGSAGDGVRDHWLRAIAGGQATATVYGLERGPGPAGGHGRPLPVVRRARRGEQDGSRQDGSRQDGSRQSDEAGEAGLRIDGTLTPVLDGMTADLVVARAVLGDGGVGDAIGGDEVLVAVELRSGAQRTALAGLDLTRRFARIELQDHPAQLVCQPEETPELVAFLVDVAATAAAAEQVGGAVRCLESAVDYAATRIQFGRPIGSFQAVKHLCADMFVRVRCAETLLRDAQAALGGPAPERSLAASAVKAYASEAFLATAKDALQVHGGSGFTWENPAHLYLRRAKLLYGLFGNPPAHRARLATLVGAAA